MFKVLLLPFRLLRLFFKLAGIKGGILFALGVGVGLLIAPETGAELRARLQARLDPGAGGLPLDDPLAPTA